ncbi:hypothetical protein AXE65_11260 [Ventosimonas gracilis]|uniref:Uncharacterized protein n=1 Tax=Ventosimonas gracilis TaxID=1680762 RepID=A0A139SW80_9GAMM|nr:hypothetical protein [Ventosimonas gracilis]KXU38886.1 hypothetical protein AXE65_11260 [Ventosimonas gracilis]
MKSKPKVTDFKLGSIFFVPFRDGVNGVFGYVKYDCNTRSNPKSINLPLADIYNRVCRLDEWSEDIKQEEIKIHDMILSLVNHFHKSYFNTRPMVLTDYHTDIIHPVKYGFFKIGTKKLWYDADAKDVVYPDSDEQYREVEMALAPYDQAYIEAIFIGINVKYGDEIPGFDRED